MNIPPFLKKYSNRICSKRQAFGGAEKREKYFTLNRKILPFRKNEEIGKIIPEKKRRGKKCLSIFWS
jgi:hypothetical protein